jgi:hypothetical protein
LHNIENNLPPYSPVVKKLGKNNRLVSLLIKYKNEKLLTVTDYFAVLKAF